MSLLLEQALLRHADQMLKELTYRVRDLCNESTNQAVDEALGIWRGIGALIELAHWTPVTSGLSAEARSTLLSYERQANQCVSMINR
ncbi:hypothetical protein IQ22_01659 [Pseudomonas duriflava]|uniref:Uncharacterized protein n=1 Tax=Pseudomonas duriflava TaxID=459528 RepID=A0A562QI47_9PSED|nr:hypothetical protein [Pseudomonas duriflava]TWI55726.1 hypothetical protein IQ22_01659 [Pseudomonas duriflava]